MSDLVDKLRFLAECDDADLGSVPSALLSSAADRIERQQKALLDARAYIETQPRDDAILEILRREIRLVACDNGEKCETCGEELDYTYRVKEGCFERCAEQIAAMST